MIKKSLLIILLLLVLSGCLITSINPFYANGTVILYPQIMGTWELVANGKNQYQPNQIRRWVIDPDTIQTYDEKGLGGPFNYKVFHVDDSDVFIDVTPKTGDSLDANDFWVTTVIPVHALLKVTMKDGWLILTPLNYQWFDAKTKAGKIKLPTIHATEEQWGTFNLKSEDWIKFLIKYKNDPQLFREESRIVLREAK